MSECSICLDESNSCYIIGCIDKLYQLECNHHFHIHCLYKFLRYDFFAYKNMGVKFIKDIRFRCPLCRENLSDNDLNKIISTPFESYKYDYYHSKKVLKNLQTQYMFFNYKYKFKKIFTTLYLSDEKNFLIQDERLMEQISSEQNTMCRLKEQYTESKKLYFTFCVD